MWSFYSTLILDVEGSADFLQFTIGGDTIQFLQVLQYKIYLNYPLNGTVTQFSVILTSILLCEVCIFEVPELTLETSQEYTIAVSILFAILGVVSDWRRWYTSSCVVVLLSRCSFTMLIYSLLSWITTAPPLSAGNMTIEWFSRNDLRAACSS